MPEKPYIPPKTLQEATFADDFLFGEVMRDKKICKEFLEALLDTPIADINYIEKQKVLDDVYDAHGVRLDVFVQAENGTVFDVEIQNVNHKDVEKRSRYYQSCIDRMQLKKGEDYSDLKDSYIIFVCNFDAFKCGEPVYERYSFLARHPDISYDDGSHVIILNSKFRKKRAENTDPRILEFLKIVNNNFSELKTNLSHDIRERIADVKNDSEKGESYMTYSMKLRDVRAEGKAEGREEGRNERDAEILAQLVADKCPDKYILSLGFSQTDIECEKKKAHR